jgi:hypothetical protein
MLATNLRARLLGGLLIVGIALACATASRAGGVPVATVTIVPADTTVCWGEDFTVRAFVEGAVDLRVFELIYKYNPTAISFVNAHAGPLVASHAFFESLQNEYDAPQDTVWYDAAVIDGVSINGSGVLVLLKFHAPLADGDSPIACQLADFRDSQNNQTFPTCIGGMVHVRADHCPTPVKRMTWGRLKAIYR